MSENESFTPQADRPTMEDLPPEIRAMQLRMRLVSFQNRFDEMNAKAERIIRDQEAHKAMPLVRTMTSSIENYETISHIVMFDKVGIKAAAKDSDWECVESHKKSLLKGTELMEKAQREAAEAKEELDKLLEQNQFVKTVEDIEPAQLSAEERKTLTDEVVAFRSAYEQALAEYQELVKVIQAQHAASEAAGTAETSNAPEAPEA